MKSTKVNSSVKETTDNLKALLLKKDFKIFSDIDHQANAESVDLNMPASRVLLFGNPLAGTKLMQKDIAISLDLPLRIAIVDDNGETLVMHQTSEDFCRDYQVEGHPVLDKISQLFDALILQIKK